MIPYLTIDEVTTYCNSPGLTADDINEASVIIDSYIGRSFGSTEHTESVKLSKKNTGYGKALKGKLRHFPRIEVTEVSAMVPSYFGGLQQTTYDPTCLWFDDDEFEYFMFMSQTTGGMGLTTVNPAIFSSPAPSVVTVKYTTGFSVIPEAIKRACGQIMDAIKANGGTTVWKSRQDFDMTILLSDKEDSIVSNGIIKLLNSVRCY